MKSSAKSSTRKATIEMLTQLWEANPTLRFGQLITLVIEDILDKDMFFIDDGRWIRLLRNKLDKAEREADESEVRL